MKRIGIAAAVVVAQIVLAALAAIASGAEPEVTIAAVDTTIVPGNPEREVDVVIYGGANLSGVTMAFQITKPGVPVDAPDDTENDAEQVRVTEVRFGGRTIWRNQEGNRPQFFSIPRTEPLPAAQSTPNFGNNPLPGSGGDPLRPPGAGTRPAQGVLCHLVVEVDEDATPGIRYLDLQFKGFSKAWGGPDPQNPRIPIEFQTEWVPGKILVFGVAELLTPAELATLERLKKLAAAADSR